MVAEMQEWKVGETDAIYQGLDQERRKLLAQLHEVQETSKGALDNERTYVKRSTKKIFNLKLNCATLKAVAKTS